MEKSEITGISRQPSPLLIMTNQKKPRECAIFQIFANDAISTREDKSMTAMAKEAFNKKKAL